jgi:hypothetical protein
VIADTALSLIDGDLFHHSADFRRGVEANEVCLRIRLWFARQISALQTSAVAFGKFCWSFEIKTRALRNCFENTYPVGQSDISRTEGVML